MWMVKIKNIYNKNHQSCKAREQISHYEIVGRSTQMSNYKNSNIFFSYSILTSLWKELFHRTKGMLTINKKTDKQIQNEAATLPPGGYGCKGAYVDSTEK